MNDKPLFAGWPHLSAAVVCTSFVACMADVSSDGAPVESTADPLVGGTNTTLRPEIGTFENATDLCTATLIGPRYVLTAGHCVGFSTTLDSAFVYFPKSSTNFTVSAIHTFGAYQPQFFTVPDNTGNYDDVALLQLSSPVPSTVATPATVSPVPPNVSPSPGEETIFGEGCKNRTTGAGSGPKQYVTFTYGATTTALCPGDSGGPVVSGAPTANGPIWGISSGYDGTPTGADEFGSASYFAEDIQGVIRAWENDGVEGGVSRAGVAYSTIANATEYSCEVACQTDTKCRGATFTSSNSSCVLMSAVSGWTFVTGAMSFAGQELAQEIYKARAGSDYSSTSGSTPELCQASCARDPRCAAYTTNTAGLCELKSAVPAATLDTTSISGVRRGLEANVDRSGVDYSHVAAASALACEQSCSTDYECRSFTWVQSTGLCYLHASIPAPTARTGVTSGVKGGLELNANRQGSDYKDFDMGAFVDVPELCQASCSADATCVAFTFVPAGRQGTDAHCWLKKGIPATTTSEGLVSGLKGMDFF